MNYMYWQARILLILLLFGHVLFHLVMASDPQNEKALVLSSQYSPAIFPEFDKAMKVFTFPLNNLSSNDSESESKELVVKIKQDWGHTGVAGVVWESAEVLSSYLIAHPEIVQNKNVLELGAGTGLCSIVASHLKAKKVIATDRAAVLHILEENVDLNRHPENTHTNVQVEILDWTQPQKFQLDSIPEVIIGADLVYIKDLFPALIETMALFSSCQTKIYFCSKMRYDRDYSFYDLVKGHDFKVDLIHSDDKINVNVYLIKKCN